MKRTLIIISLLFVSSICVGFGITGITGNIASMIIETETMSTTTHENAYTSTMSFFDPVIIPDVGAYEYGIYERNTKAADAIAATPSWTAPTMQGGGNTYYVRQDGTALNKESATSSSAAGTSMDVAVFNAETFSDGDVIYFSSNGGNFTDPIVIPSSGSDADNQISYVGAPGELPTYDGGDADATGIDIASKNHVFLEHWTVIDCTTDCIQTRGTSTGVVIVDCDVSGSGNQGFQHENSCSVSYYECTGTDCADEALSLHDTATVYSYGCTYHTNTTMNINTSQTGGGLYSYDDTVYDSAGAVSIQCNGTGTTYYFDGLTFSGSGYFSILCAHTIKNSILTSTEAANSAVTVNTAADVLLENVTIQNTSQIGLNVTGGGTTTLNDCSITNSTTYNLALGTGTITANFCTLSNSSGACTYCITGASTYNFNDVIFHDNGTNDCYLSNAAIANFTRCMFYNAGSDHNIEYNGASLGTVKYCIFKDVQNAKYAVLINNVNSDVDVYNSVFYDGDGGGSGVYSIATGTPSNVYNCIFQDVNTAVSFSNAPSAYVDYCWFYSNAADVGSTGVLGGNCSQGVDPALVSVGTGDFYLGSASGCINDGIDAGLTLDYDKTPLGAARYASDTADGKYYVILDDGSSNYAVGYLGITGTGPTLAAAKGVTGITKANPGVVTLSAGHGFEENCLVKFSGLTEMTELNDKYVVLTNKSGDTFEILDTSGYGAAETTGGNCAQRLSEPSATGVRIYTSHARDTLGWQSIDSGFDYNSTAFDYDIYN